MNNDTFYTKVPGFIQERRNHNAKDKKDGERERRDTETEWVAWKGQQEQDTKEEEIQTSNL